MQANKLRDEYLTKFTSSMSTAVDEFTSAEAHCVDVKEEVCLSVCVYVLCALYSGKFSEGLIFGNFRNLVHFPKINF